MLPTTKYHVFLATQILGTLIKKYNHGITCVVRIIQVQIHIQISYQGATYTQAARKTFNIWILLSITWLILWRYLFERWLLIILSQKDWFRVDLTSNRLWINVVVLIGLLITYYMKFHYKKLTCNAVITTSVKLVIANRHFQCSENLWHHLSETNKA